VIKKMKKKKKKVILVPLRSQVVKVTAFS